MTNHFELDGCAEENLSNGNIMMWVKGQRTTSTTTTTREFYLTGFLYGSSEHTINTTHTREFAPRPKSIAKNRPRQNEHDKWRNVYYFKCVELNIKKTSLGVSLVLYYTDSQLNIVWQKFYY